MRRICADCDRNLPQSSYTANQFSKGPGVSRCASCVHGHYSDSPAPKPSDSGRYNHSDRAEVSKDALDNPFASGSFRWVAEGIYTDGGRQGQACVVKWFKTGAVFSEDYFTLDIKAVDKALEIVNRFNQLNTVNKVVKINVPGVWYFTDDGDEKWSGQRHLCEPFIQNYRKFNSNTGWNDIGMEWAQVMQALSHFSYHVSGGNYVLCDLQAAFTSRRWYCPTLSSCPGPASMELQISALKVSAPFSVNILATISAARTGPRPPTLSNTFAQSVVPL